MKKTLSLFFGLLLVKMCGAQNVGIGTTDPQAKLDINGDIAFRSADITIASTYNYSLDVNTTKQTNYKLKASLLPPLGNFIVAGIASGADGRMITLNNRTGFSMEIYNEDVNANAENRIQTGTGNTVAVYPNGNVTLQYDATDQRWSIKSMHNNSLNYFGGGGGTSYWDLSGTDISNTNSGNVGIGTTSPVFKLDVRGKGHLQGNVLSGNGSTGGGFEIATTGIGTQTQYLNFDGQRIQSLGSPNFQTAATPKDIYLNPFGGKVGINTTTISSPLSFPNVLGNKISFWNSGATNDFGIGLQTGMLQIYTAGQDMIGFGYGSSASFTKTMTFYPGSGQLGINCLPQAGYILSVSGSIRSKEVVVETGWADYVFSNDYKLRPLKEVENFIKKNNHLPNIPSANEIQKEGLKMGEVQTRMMEKIEELTLYMIQLQKENEALLERVKKLEEKL